MNELLELWKKFEDVPVNIAGEIEEQFEHFEPGTDVTDVWLWFEEQDPDFRVSALI